jgi:murein L,D-transpeptidase YafK
MRRGLAIFAVIALVLAGLGLYEFWPDLTAPKGPLQKVDLIQVDKSKRRMQLLRNGEVVRSYRISLGSNPKGHKQREGDERTPEGRYRIDGRNSRSKFHKSLHISYPNAQDRHAASMQGVSPGGAIMIHGMPNGWGWAAAFLSAWDWTDGCIAVTDTEMDEVWKAVGVGTPIEIQP